MIDVLEIPLYYGCNRLGVNLAPDLLAKQLRKKKLPFRIRKVTVPQVNKNSNELGSMKHLNSILIADEQLARYVLESKQEGHFPLVLGGDHALGIGSVAGASSGKDFGVIWIDAHGDCNTHITTPSGNVHGMPLAASMGFGDPRLTHFFSDRLKVTPQHVLLVGIRSLDQGEIELIEQYQMEVYPATSIINDLDNALRQIQAWIVKQELKDIHLSFDVDCMDPEVFPATGTRVEGGITQHAASSILKSILNTGLVHSLDFTEYNPLLDQQGKSLKVAQDLLEDILTLIE